jgi:hypothetical protein
MSLNTDNQPVEGQVPPAPLPIAPVLPGIGLTVAISIVFGPFGAIPAAIHADKARSAGQSGARYWKAFVISWFASVAVSIIAMVVLFAGLAFTIHATAPVGTSTVLATTPTTPVSVFLPGPYYAATTGVNPSQEQVFAIHLQLEYVLSRAYTERNSDWLRYFYANPSNSSVGYSSSWHTSRIPGYTGAGNVVLSNGLTDSIEPNRITMRFNISIDGSSYQTTLYLVYVTPQGSSDGLKLWLVETESTS